MTKFKWTEPESGQARTERFDRYRGASALDREDAKRRAAGILPHNDPTDPWSDTEFRVCEPGCPQHRSAS